MGKGYWKRNTSILQQKSFQKILCNFWKNWQKRKTKCNSTKQWRGSGKTYLKIGH